MHLKMSSAKWRPFGLGLNVLTATLQHMLCRNINNKPTSTKTTISPTPSSSATQTTMPYEEIIAAINTQMNRMSQAMMPYDGQSSLAVSGWLTLTPLWPSREA